MWSMHSRRIDPITRSMYVGPLPGGTRRREHFFDAQIPDLLGEAGPEDAIPIAQKISRHLLKREGLSQLLSGPRRPSDAR
jgi:hypothetical protein